MVTDVRTPQDVEPPTRPSPAGTPPAPPGRMRHLLAGAAVGGICGALAAAGVFVALDDDGGTSATPAVETPEISREASTIPEGDIAGVIAEVQPAVVAVTTSLEGQGGGEGAGTGFVIAADGVIVTNAHVVDGAADIEVAFSDGTTMTADVVGGDTGADLAVLDVEADGLPVVELGDSNAVQVGDEVIAIGNALALEGGLSVTRGIISGPPREIGTEIGTVLESVLQTDAAINRGNSGGPLVDAQGRVIGINTAIADPSIAQNVGFAIPISHALPIIEDLRAGRVPAFLGVVTDDSDDGVVVVSVTDGSPAADAGIEEGDVLVSIGGDEIDEAGDVPAAIRSHRPGDEVEVVVERDGERVTVNATLAERPDSG
jgi:S1-C subfamily serine protease